MATDFSPQSDLRQQQDGFHSMVGGQAPYPDDPQHPDPTFCGVGPDGSCITGNPSAPQMSERPLSAEPTQADRDDKDDRTFAEKARGVLDTITDKADDMSEAAKRTFAPKNPPFPTDDEVQYPQDREPANPGHRRPHTPTAGANVAPVGRTSGDPAKDRAIESQMYGEHEI